jgi:rhodanese-related sulfurtransferase
MKLLPIAAVAVLVPLSAAAWAQTPPAQAPAQPPSAPTTPAATTPTQPGPPMDESKRVNPEDIDKLLADGKVVLLDVREPKELEEMGTVEGSIHIPLGQLETRLGELPKDRVILTACNGGGRAARALALLEKNGFKTSGFCGLKNYKGKRVHPKAPSA